MQDPRASEAEEKRVDRFVMRINKVHPENTEGKNRNNGFDRRKEGVSERLNGRSKNTVQSGNHLECKNVFQALHAVVDGKLVAGNVEGKYFFTKEEINDRSDGSDCNGKNCATDDRTLHALSVFSADVLTHEGNKRSGKGTEHGGGQNLNIGCRRAARNTFRTEGVDGGGDLKCGDGIHHVRQSGGNGETKHTCKVGEAERRIFECEATISVLMSQTMEYEKCADHLRNDGGDRNGGNLFLHDKAKDNIKSHVDKSGNDGVH